MITHLRSIKPPKAHNHKTSILQNPLTAVVLGNKTYNEAEKKLYGLLTHKSVVQSKTGTYQKSFNN